MSKRLVIVESPAKARTIAGYLGPDYVVESSVGHIRDLPQRAADIPAEYKKEKWARLGVDTEDGFRPLYVVDPDKKKKVTELRALLKDADELLLATDEDREGEAIAWHLYEVLKPKVPVRRMVFHEITKAAIERALDETRAIDARLVDAQETRRILDRLYGYEISPVLWKKIMPRLSAGRVQSVATRLVVQRERERMAFRAAEWWDILATFDPESFEARLVALDGQRIATGRDFGSDGQARTDARQLDEETVRGLASRLDGASFRVTKVEEKPYSRKPAAPFMTSTLQQEASRKLKFTAQTTMSLAQRLYENGYITYMRTDSTTLSESALAAARRQAVELFGSEFIPDAPRQYNRKVKNAQEAHEAIRPAGDSFRTPQQVQGELSRDEFRVYELIWMRTVASQMKDAQGRTVSLRIGGETGLEATAAKPPPPGQERGSPEATRAAEVVEFATSGTVITFRGFLAAYEEGRDDDRARADDDEERRLPSVSEGDAVRLKELEPQGHETNSPARYTEATLVRTLEELGIGRPSTYASIIGTILDRGYVFKRSGALVPSFLAFSVVGLLEQHFTRYVDYQFTASMEDDLDRIASGEEARDAWLHRFYYGNGEVGLRDLVQDLGAIDAREVSSFKIPGSDITIRVGRYGPYLERDGQRANIPPDLVPDELTIEKAEELLAQPSGDRELGVDPATGLAIVAKTGRYGPYVTEVLAEDSKEKPRTASLFKAMSVETVSLEDALDLLTLPRSLGVAPDGEEVLAKNGPYGPYVQKEKETRSIESEEQLLTITLEGALVRLAQPKERRGRGQAKPPLAELGEDPATGKAIVVKEGKFGPYVTDGETNASLRRGDDPESLDLDRALELLAERRAKGPAKTAAKKPTRRRKST